MRGLFPHGFQKSRKAVSPEGHDRCEAGRERTSTANIALRMSGVVATATDSPTFLAVIVPSSVIFATSLKYLQKYWYLLSGFRVLPILSAS